MASRDPGRTQAGDALSALLDAERRLAERLEAVARETESILATAERDAHRQLAALEADLAAEAEALAQSIEAGAANQVEALRRQADAAVARYHGLSDATLRDLATEVIDAVCGGRDEEPP